MTTKMRPLHDRILVKREAEETKTKSGILIPTGAQEKPMFGLVVAVGPGSLTESGQLRPLDVKVGDKVLFAKWGGTEVTIEDQEYLIMKESDVLCVVTN